MSGIGGVSSAGAPFGVDAGEVLRAGARGPEVVWIQHALAGLGYDLGPAGTDGIFGRRTAAAVAAFQRAEGLAPTGEVDRLIATVEAKVPGAVAGDIGLAAYSGGYEGLGQALGFLQRGGHPRLYDRIDNVALLDAAYGHWDELAAHAARPGRRLSSSFTDHLSGANGRLRRMVSDLRGGDMTGMHFERFSGVHGNAPLRFRAFMTPS